MSIIISIINMFLTGLMWIMAAALVFLVIAFALLVTWMQATEERTECHGCEEAPEGNGHPAEKHHRRRTAGGYPCQMP